MREHLTTVLLSCSNSITQHQLKVRGRLVRLVQIGNLAVFNILKSGKTTVAELVAEQVLKLNHESRIFWRNSTMGYQACQ
jgi:hypothetical protein